MKGSKSFTISTLSPQYRSSEGRRLPFFQLEEGQHIDDGTLLDYESMPFALLLAYETDGSPSLERVKQWAEAHERLMEWFYHEDSPCLVDPVRPNQHIDFLDERSTASRLRGRYAILIQALAMRIRLQPSGVLPQVWNSSFDDGRPTLQSRQSNAGRIRSQATFYAARIGRFPMFSVCKLLHLIAKSGTSLRLTLTLSTRLANRVERSPSSETMRTTSLEHHVRHQQKTRMVTNGAPRSLSFARFVIELVCKRFPFLRVRPSS